MGKKLVFDYEFDASAGTITVDDIYAEKRWQLITNLTSNLVIYQFNDSSFGISNISFDYPNTKTIITLAFDTASMSDTDELQIFVDDGSTDVTVNDRFIDPVSKIRVSNPENLIDTDFEYGLQSTKWETLELTANDKITLRFSLIENKVNTERRIKETTEELNSSKNIKEVRENTLRLQIMKEKLDSITNLLNKI